MVDNWSELTEELQQKLIKLNNFFCGLHGLVHIAESANAALQEAEKQHFPGQVPISDPRFRKANESGVCRLVRTACQAFALGGDAKSGCHGKFKVFIEESLKTNGFNSLPLTPYKGNRFNILFHNAGTVYWLRNEMKEFLETDGSNKWVLYDLGIPFLIAGTKALGLISKFITTPLWAIVEDKKVHILDMNQRYLQLLNYIKDAALNTDAFMCGKLKLYEDVSVKDDAILQALVEPSECDGDCKVVLSIVLPTLAKLVENMYRDHLPGGIHATDESLSSEKRRQSASTPKHNKYCETIFGFLDWQLKTKPNLSTLAAEANVMFSFNRTSDWINSKTPEDAKQLVEDAYKQVGQLRRKFKERQKNMKEEKWRQLQEKRAKEAEAKRKKVERKVKVTNDILYYSLFQSEKQVNDFVESDISTKDKIEALKAQLNFRDEVLHQEPSDSKLYNVTKAIGPKKRKNLTVPELAENVKKLIAEGQDIERGMEKETEEEVPRLIQKQIQHCFMVDGQKKWYSGTVVSKARKQFEHIHLLWSLAISSHRPLFL